MENYSYIRDNLARVRAKLAAAAARGGYPVPRLMAVTKSADDGQVAALLSSGIEAIGENRQQLFTARARLAEEVGKPVEMHLIGQLQTNKVKYVVERAALIHSLDSLRLAEEIDRQGARHGVRPGVLIEVNSGREPQKGGLLPEEVPSFAAGLSRFPNLRVLGLMTMGPDCERPEEYRPYFRETRALLLRLAGDGRFETDTPVLSMGMSDSYEIAAEEGATLVRVGRGLFAHPEEE